MNRKPMTLIGRLATAFLLLTFLLAAAPARLDAAGWQQAGMPGSGQELNRIIQAENALPGVYYIDYGAGYSFSPAVYPVDGAIGFYDWSALNPADGVYNWTLLDDWMAARKALGLGTGILLSAYNGNGSGDIRPTPDFVIKTPGAVVPATAKACADALLCPPYPHYINYWKKASFNAGFDYSPNTYMWTLTGNTAIATNPPADSGGLATGNAAKLGGVNNATGSLYHYQERIPAMPPGITPAQTVTVTARIYMSTADAGSANNDHLYMELWDTNNVKLGGTQIDVSNQSQTNNTWQTYTFDVSGFAPEKSVRVAFRVTTDGASPTTFYVDSLTLKVRHLIPNYWPALPAGRTFADAYRTFIAALGARYKANADLQFVAMGTGVYGENQPTQDSAYPESHFDHVMDNAGLTSALWVEYINAITSAHVTAFETAAGQGPNRHLLLQYAPTFKVADERDQATDYAGARKVGLSANFLSPDLTMAYATNGDGQYDAMLQWGGQVPLAFESYPMDLCSPVLTYWAVAGALDKHLDFLRTDIAMVRNSDGSLTTAAAYYDWAGQYLGRTVENTPRVWTLMYEHRNPTRQNCRTTLPAYYTGGGIYPQLGNLTYWLTQVDGIAGGKTVPETNDKGADSRYARDPSAGSTTTWPLAGLGACPTNISYRTDLYGTGYPCNYTPYNPDLPPLLSPANLADYTKWYNPVNYLASGKDAYVVRRTDQATGNPYMFFKIDDGYMDPAAGLVYQAVIRVQYFDMGTDQWSLKYESISGEKTAGAITKTNTKELKTAAFTVTDGSFANGLAGGADFYLDSRDPATGAADGNEWLHMVEAEKVDAGPALAAAISRQGDDVVLAWTSRVPAAAYEVHRSLTPHFTPDATTLLASLPAAATTYPDTGAFASGEDYFYVVRAAWSDAGRDFRADSGELGKFGYALQPGC